MKKNLNTPTSRSFERKIPIARSRRGILLVLLAASCAAGLHAAEWNQGILDTSASRFSSLKFDAYGNGHVSYVAPAANELRYGFWDHTLKKWYTTVVDRTGGFCALVLDSHQRPHISYLGYGGGLAYARWDGASWQKEKIPIPARTIGFYTSIALDQNDYPIISFYEADNAEGERLARLRTVVWNGNFWALRTVDNTPGSGKFNSIAVDSKGHPQIAYADLNNESGSVRYARWDGEAWKTEVMEGAGSSSSFREDQGIQECESISMVLGKDDTPHITYTDASRLLVKYATKIDGHWKIEVVDSLGKVAYPDRNGIGLDDEGRPYISYYDVWSGILKLAHRKGSKWVTEVVERGSAGLQSSLQLDHGTIWLTYADEGSGELKFARKPLEEIDSSGSKTINAENRFIDDFQLFRIKLHPGGFQRQPHLAKEYRQQQIRLNPT